MSTETVVRERGILMSAPMVRAVLDGRKTQTRRVVTSPGSKYPGYNALADECLRCPYGAPGERLWVRETWDVGFSSDEQWVRYRADETSRPLPEDVRAKLLDNWDNYPSARWRPSIHMPRWASRLTLEITDVRVQRVQEISEDDARAEGASVEFRVAVMRPDGGPDYRIPSSHRGGFANLWNRLNAARGYGWDANPWVWCVTFRRVEVET